MVIFIAAAFPVGSRGRMQGNDVLFKDGTQPGTPTQSHHYVPPLNPMPTLSPTRNPHLQPHSNLNNGHLLGAEPHSSQQHPYPPEPAFQTYDAYGSGLVDARESHLRSAKYDTAPAKSDVAALQSQVPSLFLLLLGSPLPALPEVWVQSLGWDRHPTGKPYRIYEWLLALLQGCTRVMDAGWSSLYSASLLCLVLPSQLRLCEHEIYTLRERLRLTIGAMEQKDDTIASLHSRLGGMPAADMREWCGGPCKGTKPLTDEKKREKENK